MLRLTDSHLIRIKQTGSKCLHGRYWAREEHEIPDPIDQLPALMRKSMSAPRAPRTRTRARTNPYPNTLARLLARSLARSFVRSFVRNDARVTREARPAPRALCPPRARTAG